MTYIPTFQTMPLWCSRCRSSGRSAGTTKHVKVKVWMPLRDRPGIEKLLIYWVCSECGYARRHTPLFAPLEKTYEELAPHHPRLPYPSH